MCIRDSSTTINQRYYSNGVVAGDVVYLLAGIDRVEDRSTEYISLDDPHNWTAGPDVPYSVGLGSCSVSPSPTTIVITGGMASLKKMSQLDVTTGTWTGLQDLPRDRYQHGCTIVNRHHGHNSHV